MTENRSAPRKKGRNLFIAVGLLVVLAVLAGGYWYLFMRGIVSTDDARIEADLVDIAPQIGGTLTGVMVNEGDHVKKGEILFRLDTPALEAALLKARNDVASKAAALAVARAQNERAKNGPLAEEVEIADAAKRRAEAEVKLAEAEWNRTQTLYEGHTITEAQRDQARTRYETTTQAYQEALKRLELLRSGTRREDLAAARATVDLRGADLAVARAAEQQTQITLDDATVEAPFDGIVVRRWRDPGATVGPGTPVLTLLDPSTLYVEANIEEKDLGDVEVGDGVDISVDAYPAQPLVGRVEKVLRATQSQFSLIPSEGVSGAFVKVTQRVPIRIVLDSGVDDPLSPGLSVEVKIHASHGNGGKTVMKPND